jgi:hypothetical protein
MTEMAASRFARPDPKEWVRFALTSFLNRTFNKDMDDDIMTRHMPSLRHQLLLVIQTSCYIVDYHDRHGKAPDNSQIKNKIVAMSDVGGLNPWCDDKSSSGDSISRNDTVSLIHDLAWVAIDEFQPLVRAVKASME